mmetsp:Transcript_885/g.1717  ORF Transcript_885/g.1717 Transcript_885/m.1717 type:complete len:224 (-) Transcript_885:789-1460(-)
MVKGRRTHCLQQQPFQFASKASNISSPLQPKHNNSSSIFIICPFSLPHFILSPNVGTLFVHNGMTSGQSIYILVVSATNHCSHWNIGTHTSIQYPSISFTHTLFANLESSQLVMFVDIDSGIVQDQIGLDLCQGLVDTGLQFLQVFLVLTAIIQSNVVSRMGLETGIIGSTMHAQCEQRIVLWVFWIAIPQGGKLGCPVSLVHVAINDQDSLDRLWQQRVGSW